MEVEVLVDVEVLVEVVVEVEVVGAKVGAMDLSTEVLKCKYGS